MVYILFNFFLLNVRLTVFNQINLNSFISFTSINHQSFFFGFLQTKLFILRIGVCIV